MKINILVWNYLRSSRLQILHPCSVDRGWTCLCRIGGNFFFKVGNSVNSLKYISYFKNKYNSVFSQDLDRAIKNFEVEIVLKEDANPIFFKPYTMPFGLRELVEKELDQMGITYCSCA